MDCQAPASIRTLCKLEPTKAFIKLETSAKRLCASKTTIMDIRKNLFGGAPNAGRAPSGGYGQPRPPPPPSRDDTRGYQDDPRMQNRDPYGAPMQPSSRQQMPQRAAVGRPPPQQQPQMSPARRIPLKAQRLDTQPTKDEYVFGNL